MAIEASKQIADPNTILIGFRLRDICIKTGLIIPDNKEGIEVKTTMSGMDESSREKSKTWRKWKVQSYNPVGDNWVEHCTGYISTEYEVATGPVDGGYENTAEVERSKTILQEAAVRCTKPASIDYDHLDNIGLHFGPLFQNLSDVRVNQGHGEVVASVSVPDVKRVMPKGFMHPHMIHPATLDGMMHLFFPGTYYNDCNVYTYIFSRRTPC